MRIRSLWWAGAVFFVALVIYLSLKRDPIDVGRFDEIKIGHFLAYAWLGLWFIQFYRSVRARLFVAIALSLLGVALEFAQGMTTYRSFAYSDMVDNAIGVLGGMALGFTPLGRVLEALEARWPRHG